MAILSSSSQEHHHVCLTSQVRICPQSAIIFFLLFEYLLKRDKREKTLKMLTLFPVSTKYPEMELFDDIREHMKTWSLMHRKASTVSSSHMLNRNGRTPFPTSPNFEVKSILFHGWYLRTSAPNYLTLHSPNIHCYFPPNTLVLGISSIRKKSSPSSHLFTWCPSLKTQTKAIDMLPLIAAVWNDLSIFLILTIFAIYDFLGVWFWNHQLQKSVFSLSPGKAVAIFPLFSQIYVATLKRSNAHMHGKGKADKAHRCWSKQLTHLNYPFLYSFSHKKFWCVNFVFVRSVM